MMRAAIDLDPKKDFLPVVMEADGAGWVWRRRWRIRYAVSAWIHCARFAVSCETS